jgi:hypothetical protein
MGGGWLTLIVTRSLRHREGKNFFLALRQAFDLVFSAFCFAIWTWIGKLVGCM